MAFQVAFLLASKQM